MEFSWMITKSTKNIGDDFQCLAARRFVENKYDKCIDREELNKNINSNTKMIMNGWYMHNPKNWPPSENIKPLLISMHFSNHRQANNLKPIDFMLNDDGVKYLQKNSPIGCRDIYSYELLNKKNVNSYFSGCLTLTLKKKNLPKKDYICLVDLDDDIYKFVKANTNREIIRVNHEKDWPENYEQRIEVAKEMLELYEQAHCILTNRLHVALPSLALETNVLLIRNKFGDERFTGLKELTNYCTKDELIHKKLDYDFENPLENPLEYLTIRKNNINIAKSFSEGTHENINYENINKENLQCIKEAKLRTINFRKKNKMRSYKYMEFLYKVRHVIRNKFDK